ncbi:energy transducer TonB [Ekhidna sp.]|uniref:energy transducer TonB n=1 Tax=Ekhidna sp. TaxID=2608089 RepID=UPI003B505045
MKTPKIISTPKSLTEETIQELTNVNTRLTKSHKELAIYEDLLAIKEEHKAKDVALRPLLLNIGMAVSILLAIIAINWKSYDDGNLVDLGEVEADLNEIIEIPVSTQPPPPPPPKQEVFKIAEVKDTEIIEDINLNLDVEVTENEALEVVEVNVPIDEEEEIEEIFVIVEQEPLPEGGLEAFYSYLAKELKYPSQAMRLGIMGSVFVQFVIEKDGSITQVQVVKGIGAGCDEEAIRVIQNAPKWIPGKQRGVPVRVKKIIPVKFIIAGTNP